jgi:uncharacterized protein YqeY
MPLVDDVTAAIAEAMRKQDAARLVPLRMLKAAFMNKSVEKGRELDDAESRQVVSALVKQRRDSIEQFTKGGRQDLADKEAVEITVLEAYLPPAVDPAAIDQAVADAIAETGATSAKDMGRVKKAAMSKLAGQNADGKTVNELCAASSALDARLRLARSAGITGAATLTSRILGLARDQVLAALFGAGRDMDAFVVAFRIPNLVRDLFAEGAMSAAFVPTFTGRLTLHGKDDAWHLANNLINALLLVTGAAVVAGVVFARPLVSAYAGDFSRVPGKLELTIALTRIMLPFLTMVSVAAACMGMLNSLHHYFMPALSPAMFNIATIVGAIALVPLTPAFGLQPITAIAMAALRGRRPADRHPMAVPPSRRIPLSSGARPARSGTPPGARADGAGDHRSRGNAGQSLSSARPLPPARKRAPCRGSLMPSGWCICRSGCSACPSRPRRSRRCRATPRWMTRRACGGSSRRRSA